MTENKPFMTNEEYTISLEEWIDELEDNLDLLKEDDKKVLAKLKIIVEELKKKTKNPD